MSYKVIISISAGIGCWITGGTFAVAGLFIMAGLFAVADAISAKAQ